MRIKQVIPTSNSIIEDWFPLDLGSLPLSRPSHDIPSLPSYYCPLPLLPPTLFHFSPWPTLTAPPAPSSTLKGWHPASAREEEAPDPSGKEDWPSWKDNPHTGLWSATAASLAGRSNF